MQKINEELKKHPFISVCLIICLIFVLIHLFYGFENILSINPSSWYSLFLGLFFVLMVYLTVDSKTSKTLEEIKSIEKNIHKETQNIKQINKQTKSNVDKSFFQIERTSALNKYPENFKEINASYQPIISSLFDTDTFEIGVVIGLNKSDLFYKVKPVKNYETSIPKTKTILSDKFYIIEVMSPSYLRGTTSEQLEDYKYSSIKEGEYYGCRFDESTQSAVPKEKGSWVMGQPLSPVEDNQRFYKFYLTGPDSSEEAEIKPSANGVMGYNYNYPGNEYNLIDQFIIGEGGSFSAKSGSLLKLFQKDSQLFFTINDSPLKKIYILKTWIDGQRKRFLVFENLRGHIRGENFVERLKNRVFGKFDINNLPEEVMDQMNYEKNHHIKILLKT